MNNTTLYAFRVQVNLTGNDSVPSTISSGYCDSLEIAKEDAKKAFSKWLPQNIKYFEEGASMYCEKVVRLGGCDPVWVRARNLPPEIQKIWEDRITPVS